MSRGSAPSWRDLTIAREFARSLAERCGPTPFTVTLFGSRARGDADEESDLDLFVALRDDDPDGAIRDAALEIACDLTLRHGVLVSAFVADRTFLAEHQGYSLLETIVEEGIRV
jgi:predicted nucleotidyltransferase